MIKRSNSHIINRNDLDSGLVKKKFYDGALEYWVYRKVKNFKEWTLQLLELKKPELFCIIVPEDLKEDEFQQNCYLVVGTRYTEEHLDEYLEKTGRKL